MTAELKRYLFSVDEYYRMAEAGIFSEDDRVELIEGEIVEMAPIGSLHAGCVETLYSFLSEATGGGTKLVRAQNPIHLDDGSEPQPDIVIARYREDRYRRSHPTSADILLIAEVADTSQAYDRDVKAPLYARHGIPEYWLVDLTAETIEVYREPSALDYGSCTVLRRGDTISSRALPDVSLAVNDILG